MATIPMLSLAVVAPGIAAAALAGALGLSLAALATSRTRRQSHGGFFHGHGHGGHGGHGGYGHHGGHGGYGHHGGGYRHRRRRSTDEEVRIGRLFEVIRAEDVTGCGLRLVCELAGVHKDQLTDEEAAILAFIGPSIKPGEGVLPRGAKGQYQMARGLGESGSNCGRQFYMCPLDGTQLMNTIVQFLP